MVIQLFLHLDGLKYYGDIPEKPENFDGIVEEYPLSVSDIKMLLNDVDSIDTACDVLLDYGDVDYFNCEKCAKLKEWIDCRLKSTLEPRYREILDVLKEYCSRAIEYNTGVVIEL